MAALADARWERFAQYRAAGLTQAEAFRAAGYKGRNARTGGWNVEQKAGVKKRIAELASGPLQNERAPRTEADAETVDQAWLLGAGKMLFKCAMGQNDLGTASVTLERLAKISGCWNERPAPDNNHVIRVYSATPLTEEEWERTNCPQAKDRVS